MSEPIFSYRTIKEESQAIYTEKRSKFIALAYPVDSESTAREIIESKRKEYYDARHVCWAYVIGHGDRIERMNDDGEPSSTAGKPIHGQILSRGLTDVLVIVVRYFGGVKLGTGGLIVAYKTAAAEALDSSVTIVFEIKKRYRLSFPFDLINPIMRLLKSYEACTLTTDTDTYGYILDVEIEARHSSAFEEFFSQYYTARLLRIDE